MTNLRHVRFSSVRKAVGFVALLLAGFAGAAVVANPGLALSGAFLLGITREPPAATAGRNLTYTLENTYQPADPEPAITVENAIHFSQPVTVVEACGLPLGLTTTDLGCTDGPYVMQPGDSATTVYVVAPTMPGTLVSTFDAYDAVGHSGSGTDTVSVASAPAGAHFANGNVCCGQSVATATAVTAADPVAASVQTPMAVGGGRTSIEVVPAGSSSLPGYTFLGWEVAIEAAPGTPADPLRLAFLLDDSLLPPGDAAGDVVITRNGVPVPDCGPSPPRAAGAAEPDPCVLSRTDLAAGDVELVVLTSQASRWEFAVSDAAVDGDPPVLVLPSSQTVNARSPAGAIVSYVVSADDAVDPSPVVSCAPASGSTFAIGAATVSCTASDAAGNEARGSFTVRVRGAVEQIVSLVDKTLAYLDQPGPAPALRARLEQAAADLVASKKAFACKGLGLYVVAVKLAPVSALNVEEKTELVGDANRIRTVIGCT